MALALSFVLSDCPQRAICKMALESRCPTVSCISREIGAVRAGAVHLIILLLQQISVFSCWLMRSSFALSAGVKLASEPLLRRGLVFHRSMPEKYETASHSAGHRG
jgi:hypothetical protein